MLYSFRAHVDGQKVTLTENNPVGGKYEAIVILTAPLNTDAIPPTEQSTLRSPRPEYQTENTKPLFGTQPGRTTFAPASPSGIQQSAFSERSNSTITPSLNATTASIKDTLSPLLYSDKEKREARRKDSSNSDVYADVNKDTYQRFMQGEQISLLLEESASYLSSPFILVENQSQLYLNFHQFNEVKQVSQDKEKMLSQVFEIKGSLPNFVKACIPAQMISKNNGYVISKKGLLLL